MRLARRSRHGLMALLLSCVLALSINGTASPAHAANKWDIDSYAPAGTVNSAPSATVTTSTGQQYANRLIDGYPGPSPFQLWISEDSGVNAGGQITLALAQTLPVARVVIFPRADDWGYGVYYPVRYRVSLLDSAGTALWSKEISHPETDHQIISEPDVIDIPNRVTARQVRIDVLQRQAKDGGLIQLSEIAVFTAPPAPPVDYRPAGTLNLAPSGTVTASSTYDKPEESWSTYFATNSVMGYREGWSTDPYERNQDPSKPATLSVKLRCAADISRVVVYPRQRFFPQDLRIEASVDGTTWTTIGRSTGNPSLQDSARVFDAPAGTKAQYVRMVVEKRNGPSGADGYLAQISELAVYGKAANCVWLVKPALELKPGTIDDSWFETLGVGDTYTVSSSKPQFVTVDAKGAIKGVRKGSAVVTLKAGATTLSVPVTVVDDPKRIGDDFSISVYWPPTVNYVNAEQYKYLGEAGITLVENVQDETTNDAYNMKMAELANRNGMQILAKDHIVGLSLKYMDAAAIQKYAKRYTNVPGIGGIFIIDEPLNAMEYAKAYNAMDQVAPDYYKHLNFFPFSFYGGPANSDKAMQSWLDATGPHTMADANYLKYDRYPFKEGTTDYADFFTNLDSVRTLGLKNSIKTSSYLQSIGIPGYMRRPNAAEVRYEANVSMAYGYKQLVYFTWWTPSGRSEPFTDGIMTADGRKTDLYEPVKKLNSEITALGPTLMKLDAKEVYLSGNTYGQKAVPASFFVQPKSGGDLVISHMVDRVTGEDYVFVVNNSFTAGQDVKLKFGDSVTAVREVKRDNGKLGGLEKLSSGELTRHLNVSEGVLYKIIRNGQNGNG